MNVKICGLVKPRDAALALDLGATHLGCVVAPDSPRSAPWVARRAIRELARGRAQFALVVRGLELAAVRELVEECRPDLVQWHGLSVAAERDLAAELPLLRVRQIAPDAVALPLTSGATPERPFVLDGGRGGAGQRFPWSLLAGGCPANVFIAGGVDPESLAQLRVFAPWGIDVSSGIESAPGRKDPVRMRALFANLEVAR